jgi:hypothetical protein
MQTAVSLCLSHRVSLLVTSLIQTAVSLRLSHSCQFTGDLTNADCCQFCISEVTGKVTRCDKLKTDSCLH